MGLPLLPLLICGPSEGQDSAQFDGVLYRGRPIVWAAVAHMQLPSACLRGVNGSLRNALIRLNFDISHHLQSLLHLQLKRARQWRLRQGEVVWSSVVAREASSSTLRALPSRRRDDPPWPPRGPTTATRRAVARMAMRRPPCIALPASGVASGAVGVLLEPERDAVTRRCLGPTNGHSARPVRCPGGLPVGGCR